MPILRHLAVALIGLVLLGASARADIFVADFDGGTISQIDATGAQTTFAANLASPIGLAFDAAGNLYEAEGGSGTIYQYTPAGVKTVFANGFTHVFGLAFDASGNLFVSTGNAAADFSTIVKITPAGAQSIFATNLDSVRGLAFDSAGNLYAADLGAIYKFTPAGDQSTFATVDMAVGLAFDSAGNLYAGDHASVDKITPDGTITQFTTSVTDARWLTFDAAGDLYVTDVGDASGTPGQGTLLEFSPDGQRIVTASSFDYPLGVAIAPPPTATPVSVTGSVDLPTISRAAGQFATVTFARSGTDVSTAIKVNFTVGGTLTSGVDYKTLPTTKKIKAGAITAAIKIKPLAGGADGSVKVTIKPGDGYAVGGDPKVKVKIK